MNQLRKLFGLHPMNEAPAAEAPAATAAPDAAPDPAADSTTAPAGDPSSLLGAEAPAATDKPAEGEAKPEGEKTSDAPVVPEAYEAFTVPEGMEIEESVLPDVHAVFKDLGLSQEKANEVFGKLLAIQQKMELSPEAALEQQQAQVTALSNEWTQQIKNDPELGGANFEASLAQALLPIQAKATPELRDVLNLSGLGSNPHFFRFMHALGGMMREDAFVQGGTQTGSSRRSDAEVFYGSQK